LKGFVALFRGFGSLSGLKVVDEVALFELDHDGNQFGF